MVHRLPMGANIEVKARIRNWARQHAEARRLAGGDGEIIEQVDTFFTVPSGHLKLRQLGDERGELIFYERPDLPGPKLSEYSISHTTTPAQLCETLARALTIYGEVRKRRFFFISTKWESHTRIHLDEVKGLGQFIELEVVLAPGQSPEIGEKVAEKFRTALDIRDADLIDCAYVDLMTARGCGP
jgi:adenylate cyclase class IV